MILQRVYHVYRDQVFLGTSELFDCLDKICFNMYNDNMNKASKNEKRQLEEQVFLEIQRTADRLMYGFSRVLKDVDISPAQYNVLRILRGAGKEGLSCSEVGRRLVTAVPDVTRLLDRLEARKLVQRSREGQDRRVITVYITDAGLALLASLDEPVHMVHKEQLGHAGREKLMALMELLELVRTRVQLVVLASGAMWLMAMLLSLRPRNSFEQQPLKHATWRRLSHDYAA